MQNLNIPEFPLHGTSLIEASAGTGKTFTIVNLYLRLILGHQCEPLTVDKILVVTFTNAATEELKERIRSRLNEAWKAFYCGDSDDPLLSQLLEGIQDKVLASRRLMLAMQQMDEASVFTIHGFCHRILSEFAFESGSQYDQQLVTDETEWLHLAVNDFWRSKVVTLDSAPLELLLSCYKSPQDLMLAVRSLISQPVSFLHSGTISQALTACDRYHTRLAAVRQWWQSAGVFTALSEAKLKGNVKLGKTDTLRTMQNCMQDDGLHPPFQKEGWSLFGADKVKAARSKTSPDLSSLGMERFDELQTLYANALESIQLAYLNEAVSQIKAGLAFHKQRLNMQSPDDLLSTLNNGLVQDTQGHLASIIRANFPAAMIDEFQDTDPVQFDIFRRLYADSDLMWLMIGDPKQAIYGFRGADIFTYIEAKRLVNQDRHYTLAVNWRSNPALIACVNRIFSHRQDSFLAGDDIPFIPVEAAKNTKTITLDGHALPSLSFYVPTGDEDPTPTSAAEERIAAQMALQIRDLLSNGKLADRNIEAGDCCVLVRDRNEAAKIRQVLTEFNVPSVFLARNSVFETHTARSLYLLLQAVSTPASETKIRAALASDLFCYDATSLEKLFTDDVAWQSLVDDFYVYRSQWHQHGVMSMLNMLLAQHQIPQKLVASYTDGARILTDMRHLGELLQQQSVEMPADSQLLSWFYHQLFEPEANNDGQQVRLETDANLVQVVTMHASKGLEFPLVFIPFGSRFREASNAIYYSAGQGRVLDPLKSEASMMVADRERLAEDIRLFYVAITRAQYYCGIGLWNIAHGRRKQESMLRACALGQLIVGEEQGVTQQTLLRSLTQLAESVDIQITPLTEVPATKPFIAPSDLTGQQLENAKVSAPVYRAWQLTSYSAISKHQVAEELNRPGYDEGESALKRDGMSSEALSRFTFTRGAQAGSFLHGVLENIRFDRPEELPPVISKQAQWYGIEEKWLPVVQSWLEDVLFTPISLGTEHLALNKIAPRAYLPEMEFYLPLKQVSAGKFNALINRYSKQVQRQYQFDQLNGMLKGFIDLTFSHKGQYFVADYKSNHLGDDIEDYKQDLIEHAMVEHDYHLQGVLYVLALHRWLKQRLPDYQYEKHIGGACYLFLRGMSASQPGYGVYTWRPHQDLISQLDGLFDGESDESEEGQLSLW